ncbi:hypothetical protein [Microbacterium sp. P04]|uniref:hypothetical protein n=1 Tax=Microbacterium sp. P04 TaxID=3366947 RepID=UPI003745BB18
MAAKPQAGKPQAEKLGVVCTHVLNDERPVLLVANSKGDIVLTCGGTDHRFPEIEDWAMAHPSHFVGRDPAMGIVSVIAEGEWATRSRVGAPWQRGFGPVT